MLSRIRLFDENKNIKIIIKCDIKIIRIPISLYNSNSIKQKGCGAI